MKTVKDVIENVADRYNLLVFIREGHDIKTYEVDDGVINIPPEILKRRVKRKWLNKAKYNMHVQIDI